MLLHNPSTDETAEFTLRDFCPADAPQIIACIRDAYGDTYVKPFLYTEEGVRSCDERGIMRFSVAETAQGVLAGITAYELDEHFPGMAEIACQVILRVYHGYGLALPLALHSMHRADAQPLTGQFARALGCMWTLAPPARQPEQEDRWEQERDERHATLSLWARTCGEGFARHLSERLGAVAELPGQTVNLYLNLSRSGSAAAYEAARRHGFFFTGFLPCAADGVYMILHHALNVPVELDGIPYIPEYAPFVEQIRRQLWQTQ